MRSNIIVTGKELTMNEKIVRLIQLNVQLLKEYTAMQKAMQEIYGILKDLKPEK